MRSNMRNDMKLNNLYSQENARLSSIASWRVESTAEKEGVVSFYTDGYERFLNGDTIQSLTVSQVQKVLSGQPLGEISAREKDVYRLVNQNHWYVALVADANTWNPVVGQEYYLQMQGFEDLAFTANVTSVQKEGGTLLAVFEINDPIGPLIYQRTGKAMLSITISGLSVTSKALSEQNGQIGVWLNDVPGGTFIPVEVLSNDGKNALIQPLVEGALSMAQRVLIK